MENLNRVQKIRIIFDKKICRMEDHDKRCWAYGHSYAVSAFCALLATKRGQNAELATIAGLMHDIYSFLESSENHAVKGAEMTREILEKLKILTKEEIDLICTAIKHHTDKDKKFSDFDEILIDADVMHHAFYDVTIDPDPDEASRFDAIMIELGLK
ncbi:MAG: HD domain-containing protein [Candidatus Improbicoccus devescovinae]|nr:MAG: HD domain-containing protein [Candidatus Improbicoccus devescovinae]